MSKRSYKQMKKGFCKLRAKYENMASKWSNSKKTVVLTTSSTVLAAFILYIGSMVVDFVRNVNTLSNDINTIQLQTNRNTNDITKTQLDQVKMEDKITQQCSEKNSVTNKRIDRVVDVQDVMLQHLIKIEIRSKMTYDELLKLNNKTDKSVSEIQDTANTAPSEKLTLKTTKLMHVPIAIVGDEDLINLFEPAGITQRDMSRFCDSTTTVNN